MARKATLKTETACQDMLRAASVMPHQQGIDHVKEQSSLLFTEQNGSFEVAELELSTAQDELEQLTKELEALRHERRKYPCFSPSEQTPEQEDKNDESN